MTPRGGTITGSAYSGLRRLLDGRCRVDDDPLVRRSCSADASTYRRMPQVVVFPACEADVARTVRYAAGRGIPVTARGAGTGLAGGALGGHIILDMHGMGGVRVEGNTVTAGPGASKGALDAELARHGKFFSPDPSVGPYCSVGGMVGTNAGGVHALKYGCVIDNLLGVTLVDGTGRVTRLPGDAPAEGVIHGIAAGIDRAGFPDLPKNSCGYRLDAVGGPRDAHKVIAGSEGTLGIVTSARFRVWDVPRRQSLTVISHDGADGVCDDVHAITGAAASAGPGGGGGRGLDPCALEYLDAGSAGAAGIDRVIARCGGKKPGGGGAGRHLLFVEIDGQVRCRTRRLCGMTGGRVEISTCRGEDIRRLWRYRNSALVRALGCPPGGGGDGAGGCTPLPHVIEDAAVPARHLRRFLGMTDGIGRRYGIRSVVYGHIGSGNLHVRMSARAGGISNTVLNAMAEEFFTAVIGMGGTITAEHGDGIVRTGFVARQYGPRNHAAFMELKRAMDPAGILNPHKIVGAQTGGVPAS